MASPQNPSRANHFVSQAFQRPFSDPAKSGQIWRYDKRTGEVKLLPIKVNAVANDLYSVSGAGLKKDLIEHGIFEFLEKLANPIISKLVQDRRVALLSIKERGIISLFMAAQIVRVPRFLVAMQEMSSELMTAVLRHQGKSEEIIAQWAKDAEAKGAGLSKNEIKDCLENTVVRVDQKQALLDGLGLLFKDLTLGCLKFNWSIFEAADGAFFCTSDNPVVLFDRQDDTGIPIPAGFSVDHSDSEIHMPISPKRCIYLTKRDDPGIRKIGKNAVRDINRRGAFLAHRYVYAPFHSNSLRKILQEFAESKWKADVQAIERIVARNFDGE